MFPHEWKQLSAHLNYPEIWYKMYLFLYFVFFLYQMTFTSMMLVSICPTYSRTFLEHWIRKNIKYNKTQTYIGYTIPVRISVTFYLNIYYFILLNYMPWLTIIKFVFWQFYTSIYSVLITPTSILSYFLSCRLFFLVCLFPTFMIILVFCDSLILTRTICVTMNLGIMIGTW